MVAAVVPLLEVLNQAKIRPLVQKQGQFRQNIFFSYISQSEKEKSESHKKTIVDYKQKPNFDTLLQELTVKGNDIFLFEEKRQHVRKNRYE